MFGWDCCYWSTRSEYYEPEPLPDLFSLPAPLPRWPQGGGFSTGRICLGELEVAKVTTFESIWTYTPTRGKEKGITFYEPTGIPEGFFCLGHYCQSNDNPLRGYVLVARAVDETKSKLHQNLESSHPPNNDDNDKCAKDPSIARFGDLSNLSALEKPLNYMLVWSSDAEHGGTGFIWLPNPPIGYRATGFLVTHTPEEPSVNDIRCVRSDLTENCEACDVIVEGGSNLFKSPFWVWKTRPCQRGMFGSGVSIGTFFFSTYETCKDDVLSTRCLKNQDHTLHAMPNSDQVHALISHYGPTVYFHPDEIYLPSSVQWFFDNGALLYKNGESEGKRIDSKGSVLPKGGINDGEFWLDLPKDGQKSKCVKCGNLESAELYVHVKPALGGTFTDIVMWVFCPFNGPATLKLPLKDLSLSRVGEHVSDWEHFTLRVSNFNGELWSMYFSQHSGGEWVDASNLEYITGNKPIVYSSKDGHSSFPHPGTYLLGPYKLGVGVRNDVAKSKFFVDSSTKYEIVAAEYLGDAIKEPCWLQFMREWGPTITYKSSSEVEKIINHLPIFVKFSLENLLDLFPTELYGEEGPTGPKEKDNWFGDERW
ncbi:hypothetical protein Cgig2_024896 [Carnegiea gigantea]|uniref:Vacuolar protein sorting-associated protein 62 n=1 Tax=Carnegiea gigantea TaxID=171969 RepID=A0A9Q1KE63_9CARY|nr:hypothetical protein Cgig2_024896 [Carnegiea gigantea]